MADAATAEAALRQAADEYAGRLVFLSSLGAEDQVLTDMIARLGLAIPIATLDTGRLFPEIYSLIDTTQRRYRIKMKVYSPDRAKVEAFVEKHGINGFRDSLEARHECCAARKLDALRRALAGNALWVCGLRREQSPTRTDLKMLEDDTANGLKKLSPLIDWTERDVWDYIRDKRVPYNPLHDAGYPSIGCACCTRAVKRTEDVRAGRWWWESAEHKECGLHRR
ncbi:MAG: phosphoadenylyl-sulfate reductase [Kiritimatiellae bacterium]|nr:phosphoadenylyl-sulfate reductase [Kiritimatiellia bacterium]